MTVTGHVPNGMTIDQAAAVGMDHVAHLAIRGEAGSDEVKKTIAFLRDRKTVIDPTQSWNELPGHAVGTPIAAFQPGVLKIPAPLHRVFSNAGAAGTVLVEFREEAAVLDLLLSKLDSRDPDPILRAELGRLALLRASNGVDLDISFAAFPFEVEVLQRASDWQVPAIALRTSSTRLRLRSARPVDFRRRRRNPPDDVSSQRTTKTDLIHPEGFGV